LIVSSLGPAGPVMVIAGLGMGLVLLALPSMLNRRADPLDKLRRNARKPVLKSDPNRALRSSEYADKLEKYAHFLEPAKAEELSAAKMKMLRAGYRSKNAVRSFHAAQFVLGLSLLAVGVIYTLATKGDGEADT